MKNREQHRDVSRKKGRGGGGGEGCAVGKDESKEHDEKNMKRWRRRGGAAA
jgi:hypothetical protein